MPKAGFLPLRGSTSQEGGVSRILEGSLRSAEKQTEWSPEQGGPHPAQRGVTGGTPGGWRGLAQGGLQCGRCSSRAGLGRGSAWRIPREQGADGEGWV